MELKSSLVMTTYNGEKYIVEQMESIRSQSTPIDEVLIFDDRSTDRTVSIIRKFIGDNNLDNWKLVINKINKGYIQNFFDGVSQAQNEIIYLADQDDIWHHDKVKIINKIFNDFRDVKVVSSAYNKIIDGKLVENKFSGKIFENISDQIIQSRSSKGCLMALHKDCVDHPIYRISKSYVGHDWYIDFVGTLLGKSYKIDLPLINYRLHDSNASINNNQALFKITYQNRLGRIKEELMVLKWIKENSLHNISISIDSQIKFCSNRLQILEKKAFFVWLLQIRNLPKYTKLYNSIYIGLKQYFGDFAYSFKN